MFLYDLLNVVDDNQELGGKRTRFLKRFLHGNGLKIRVALNVK